MSETATPDADSASRPEHADATTSHPTPGRARPRRYLRVLAVVGTVVLTLVTFAAVLVAGALVTGRDLHPAVPTSHGQDSAGTTPATHGVASRTAARQAAGPDGRLVVAFVAGETGTVASDLLAPYDIFASSPAFSTYVVAAHPGPVALEGGPALLPTHTFADVDADPALTPDLVVVPALTDPTGTTEAPLRQWVSAQHDDGARILGVCAGALVLAETGMLDGLDATSHWSRIGALSDSRPAVHWVAGRRWVEDGSVTTTAAVSSGVPASLHLVAELAGPAEAQRIADQHPELGWTPQQSTAISKDHFTVGDWPVGLDFVEPWFRPTVGIALADGVGELDATAAFEVYTQSAAARTVPLGSGDTVRTRHGLVLFTTSTDDDPSLSRIVVPGGADLDPQLRRWADDRDLDVEVLGTGSGRGGGFAAALDDLVDHAGGSTAATTAKMIGYPTTGLDTDGGPLPVRTVLLAIAGLALAGLVGRAPVSVVRRRRRSTAAPATTG